MQKNTNLSRDTILFGSWETLKKKVFILLGKALEVFPYGSSLVVIHFLGQKGFNII